MCCFKLPASSHGILVRVSTKKTVGRKEQLAKIGILHLTKTDVLLHREKSLFRAEGTCKGLQWPWSTGRQIGLTWFPWAQIITSSAVLV